ncbi:hypothetical protein A1O3_04068 [Capronia epimyces CBS 606.96]|uniref:Uncharacterized protein n=1 Tax=Capronia epimyces CBS 606.96 TaxID=1182542 RepID=W9YBR7_9EURO|nr:uncharacterized protein A1O3_04068 [Capronia epimyces CBS 606.96]EXJ87110.1 hypothetical protein A1O3_04068 [Capronia epimyces CBS 606.96]
MEGPELWTASNSYIPLLPSATIIFKISIYNADCSFLLNATASDWCPSIHVLPLDDGDVYNYLDAHPDLIARYLKERAPLAESLLKEFLPGHVRPAETVNNNPAEKPGPDTTLEDDLEVMFPGVEFDKELFVDDVDEVETNAAVDKEQEQQEPILVSDDESEEEHDGQSVEATAYDQESEDEYDHESKDHDAHESEDDSDPDFVDDHDQEPAENSDQELDEEVTQAAPDNGTYQSDLKSLVSSPSLSLSGRLTPASPILSPLPCASHPSPAPAPSPALSPSPRSSPVPTPSTSPRPTPQPARSASYPPSPTPTPEGNSSTPEGNSFLPFPAPANLVAASRMEPEGKKWRLFEEEACIQHMVHIRDEGKIKGEARFAEAQRRMAQIDGITKTGKFAVKNFWNRVGRARSGFDERKNKNAPLATSQQGKPGSGGIAQPKPSKLKRKAQTQTQRRASSAKYTTTPGNKRRRIYETETETDSDDDDKYATDDSEPVRAPTRKRDRDDSEDEWQPDEQVINALQKGLRAPKKARIAY